MKKQIMKVPKDQVVVAFGLSQRIGASRVELEKDVAINQQAKKLETGKTGLPTQLVDLLRRRERGQSGCHLRIANLEHRAGARAFQDHVVAAPSHVGKTRENENVGIAQPRGSWPIIRKLRFDDDLVLARSRAAEPVLQKTVPGQSPD